MQPRQQSALRECAGQVRRILTSYGVHHEQIKRLNESMRGLYSLRPDRKQRSTQGHASASREQDSMTLLADASENLPGRARQKITAMRCHRCGEEFPLLDFHYTKKSGLCIPCWETKVV
jgi:formylmethanofuran dehydrogenase subunit E